MTDPTLPPSLAAELAEFKRRLDNLERSPRLPFSSTRGGSYAFLDETGALRFVLGNETGLDGSINGFTTVYGTFGHGDGGAIVLALRDGDRGIVTPSVPVPFHDATPKAVTSGTFQGLWEARQNFCAHEVLNVVLAFVTDASTTGEIKLLDVQSGTSTAVASLPANTSGFAQFQWLHPATCGLYDDRAGPSRVQSLFVSIQARRTGGAGNVTVFPPQTQDLTSRFLFPDAAANGNPTVG